MERKRGKESSNIFRYMLYNNTSVIFANSNSLKCNGIFPFYRRYLDLKIIFHIQFNTNFDLSNLYESLKSGIAPMWMSIASIFFATFLERNDIYCAIASSPYVTIYSTKRPTDCNQLFSPVISHWETVCLFQYRRRAVPCRAGEE